MRLILKFIALPFMLATGILYLVCKFLVLASGAVLGIISGIVFLASLILFFYCWIVGGTFVAGDCISYQPLWSADGSSLAGWTDWWFERSAEGFCYRLSKINVRAGC